MAELGFIGEFFMQNNEIIFIISEQERIKIILPCVLDNIWRYDFVEALYVKDGVCELVIYSNDEFVELLRILSVALTRALAGNCVLDELVKEDVGLMWNIYLDSFKRVGSYETIQDCMAQKNLLWETLDNASWFYERNGKFFFEVTPVYKWHSRYPEKEEKKDYVPFEQFIKNYKPYVITELSVEIVREWLRQTEHLLEAIESNDAKYLVKNEEDEKLHQADLYGQQDDE